MLKQKNRNIISNLIWSVRVLSEFKISYLVYMVIDALMKGMSPIVTLLLTQEMINNIQMKQGAFYDVLTLLVFLTIFEVINEIGGNIVQTKLNNCELEFSTFIQINILDKVSELDSKDFENSTTHDLVSRAQYDADLGVLGNIKALFSIFSLAITTLSYMTIILKYNALIFFAIIIIPIIRYYFEKKYNLVEYEVINKNTEKERKSSYISYLLTDAEHFKEIKMNDLFNFFIKKYEKIKFECNEDLIKLHNKRTILFNVLGVLEVTIDFFVISNIITQAFMGKILIGEFILYNNAINNLKQNLIGVFSCFSVMYKNNSIVSQVKHFFELAPEKINAEGFDISEIRNIRFENVSYRYKGSEKYTLSDINIGVESGEFVVLMGYNGSGKSTLIKILMGIYNDYEGEIYVNNVNRKLFNLAAYRHIVGVLFQDYIKYETTIPENIWYGDLKYKNDINTINEMLKKVSLEEEIDTENNALGYQFNDGRQLSIGQWQKLALARTLIKNAGLYIFDEPNAALDLVSENAVLKSIYNETRGKISLIIMHRFNGLVKKADKIVVLENGRVQEEGVHEELLEEGGIYAELYSIQNEIDIEKTSELQGEEN